MPKPIILEKPVKKEKAYSVLAERKFEAAEPPTEIELLQVGDYDTPWKGEINNSVQAFKEMVKNFNEGAGKFQPGNKLPINKDHFQLEAVGWIHKLEVRGNSLWGTEIEWTPEGERLIREKQYAYVSSEWYPTWQNPLDREDFVDNVFEGCCLTNYPLFPGLSPLSASHKQKKALTDKNKDIKLYLRGSLMKLEDLLKKKIEDLTDEEKAFIVEHKDELDDEQKKTYADILKAAEEDEEEDDDSEDEDEEEDEEEDEDDTDEDEEPGKKGKRTPKKKKASKYKKVSADRLKKLEADAAKGARAAKAVNKMKAEKAVDKMIISASNKKGKFVSAHKKDLIAFYDSLDSGQKASFKKLVANLPELPESERISKSVQGKGAQPAQEKLEKKIKEIQQATKTGERIPSFMEARKQALNEDKELAKQIEQEEGEE